MEEGDGHAMLLAHLVVPTAPHGAGVVFVRALVRLRQRLGCNRRLDLDHRGVDGGCTNGVRIFDFQRFLGHWVNLHIYIYIYCPITIYPKGSTLYIYIYIGKTI